MNRRITLSPKQRQDIKGFEEVMDLILGENDRIEELRRKREIERSNDTYELYNFLESDRFRLEKIDDLLTKMVPNILQNPQTPILITRAETKRDELQEQLIKEIDKENSSFHEHMLALFNSAFFKNQNRVD